jgi:2-polyprenyl-3-methyl-5-hydroxy-6-metoxy-1,4-benzoquinol methylase
VSAGGNTYDKYASANPIERRLVGRFLATVAALAHRSGARSAHEVGCGEGEVAMRLAGAGMSVRGSDRSAEVIEEARDRAAARGLQIPFAVRSIDQLDPAGDAAELLVCCEVIEHLPDPEAAVAGLAGLADPWLLASVPREPLWRALNLARGAYVRDWGNTPGHRNHFSRRSFVALLSRHLEVVTVRSPLPWTVALCRARG